MLYFLLYRMKIFDCVPFFLRRFLAVSVLIRCIYHYAEALQKLKKYEDASILFDFLIKSKGLDNF